MKAATSLFKHSTFVSIVLLILITGFTGATVAQDDVDLSDNEVCMECHTDMQWSAPENSGRPRVHEDSGQFIQEAHEMWSCTDCHTDIVEIPHRDDVVREVQCTNCHDTTPE